MNLRNWKKQKNNYYRRIKKMAAVNITDNAYSFREERTKDAALVGLLEGIHRSLETIAGELTKLNESKSTTKK